MRLDKAVTLAGLTRTEAKKAIAAGRVTVNATRATDPSLHVDPANVAIDGVPMQPPTDLYIMLNKPAGVLTATEDRRLPTVLDLLPPDLQRRAPGPVGRLDRDVTGLVLLTTDGQLAHRLISPKWKAEKRYRAACLGRLTQQHVRAFADGLALSDFTAKPARLEILTATDEASTADVVLTEGKFHQVKRMFAAIGCPLTALQRLQIGPLTLDPTLSPGAFRPLSEAELNSLKSLVNL